MTSTRGIVELIELVRMCQEAIDSVGVRRQLAWKLYKQVQEEHTPIIVDGVQEECAAYAAFSNSDSRLCKLRRLRRRLLGEIAITVVGHAALAVIVISAAFSGVLVAYLRMEGFIEGSAPLAAIPQFFGSSMLLIAALGLKACNETCEDTEWIDALQVQVDGLSMKLARVSGMAGIPFWQLMLSSTPILAYILLRIIVDRLGALSGNRSAVAEVIENNVRRKILKDQLTDPAYFEKMSSLLDEIIKLRKEHADNYEEYLKRIGELVKQVEAGRAAGTPAELDTPGKRALWNNLGQDEALALRIDATIKEVRPDGWRGVMAREQVIKAALYGVLQDVAEVERVFLIIKAQGEY